MSSLFENLHNKIIHGQLVDKDILKHNWEQKKHLQKIFDSVSPDNEVLPNHPEVFIDISNYGQGFAEDDKICVQGLISELKKHNLMPDGQTFYCLDFGLPHFPSQVSALLELQVVSNIYTDPSEKTIISHKGHYQRYAACCVEMTDEIKAKRELLILLAIL